MAEKTKRSLWVVRKNKRFSKKYIGLHLLAEFWGGKTIESPKELKRILIKAAREGKNTPLKSIIYKFSPQGITGILLLAESHIALHEWPEYNYLAVDIFSCGQNSFPQKALDYLKRKIRPKKVQIKEIKRGEIL